MAETYKVAGVEKYSKDVADIKLLEVARPALQTETQVEIEVHAASLNPIDYKRAWGMVALACPEKPPVKLGFDVAGVVRAVGGGVGRLKVGDRVYGRVETASPGTIGELAVAEEAALGRIPDGVGFDVAATVPLAGLTAKQSLEAAGLRQGQTVFVNAGLGGVGMFALALARHHFKASVVATTVSPKKRELAAKMGATRVIDYTAENYTEVLRDAVDVGFDTLGDGEIYRVIKPGGQAVSVAMLPSGTAFANFGHRNAPLTAFGRARLAVLRRVLDGLQWFNTRALRAKGIQYRYLLMEPSGADLEATFNPLLESGVLVPAISNTYPFTDEGVRAAFTESIGGHATGKIVVKVRE
ncbi:hypothetical protein H4R18_001642 [Coemansia javaensis]|uniref:Enoyl reductase (ER) domain-containing protein n=1 Tax=Coemansia javaensis TaxID=2761396 RepID=A0A9W8HJ03_9FUNG|nr:hypothetical protein H4R18_001642 [Coemansia javaensis]